MKRKKIYTAIAGTLLLILYIVIFCFSAEDGESSSAISTRVTLVLYKLYYGVTGYEGGSQIVANAVAFFAAEQSGYLTGQVLCADGGMAM